MWSNKENKDYEELYESSQFRRIFLNLFNTEATIKNKTLHVKGLLLNRAPSSTQRHLPPPISFEPPPSSLQHPQRYYNQNIACNWAISPNLDQKIQSCPFWLKTGTHGIMEVLIPNPDLNFSNPKPKIKFWANLGWKI